MSTTTPSFFPNQLLNTTFLRRLTWSTIPRGNRTGKIFATDGKRLYFAVEDRQSDVFVAGSWSVTLPT